MAGPFIAHLEAQLADLEKAGLYKHERVIDSQQSARIHVQDGGSVLNFCANNYLGLADHPEIIADLRRELEKHRATLVPGTPQY